MSELFLKNEKVLTLKDIEGVPCEILKIDAPELLPLCLKENCTNEKFINWLQKRRIPECREGFKDVSNEFGLSWMENKNYASLSDQYWVKKRMETWKKINFFTNVYSKDIGDMFFSPWVVNNRKINNFSPDLTTGGVLRKRWIQNGDKTSYLVKAGSIAARQEPLSEVLVSVLVEQLEVIKSAGYDLCIEGTIMCCRCDNFINENTELIPAGYLYFTEMKDSKTNVYTHLLKMCDKFEVPYAKEHIDWVLFIDSLTGNEDRHLGNIGFIRDINTRKFIGPSPLFDCGNAYWSTKKINDSIKSKMFGDVENEIFNRLKNKCNIDIVLKNMSYKKIINTYPGISDTKKSNLIEAIEKRNNRLCKTKQIDDIVK